MTFIHPSSPLPLASFGDLVSKPIPPPNWMVEPLFSYGDRVVVYGEYGSLKSWTLLDLALHCAAGKSWLGRLSIPYSNNVLYIDEEMNERTLYRRISRLAAGTGITRLDLPLRVLSRHGIKFGESDGLNLGGALTNSGFAPHLIIIESFRRVLEGREIEAQDVGNFWRSVDPLSKAGITIIVSHHMRKPSFQSRDEYRNRASGSTDIIAGADAAFAIGRLRKQGLITFEDIKSREAEEMPPFVLSLQADSEDGPAYMRYEGLPQKPKGRVGQLEHAVELSITLLASNPSAPMKTGQIVDYLKAQGVKERTAQRAIKELKSDVRVESPVRGQVQLAGNVNAQP